MKFKSNAKLDVPKENGTIFELKDNRLRIRIHRVMGIEGTWFLSCAALGFTQMDLREKSFDKAVKKTKETINHKIGELIAEYEKIVGDDLIEIE